MANAIESYVTDSKHADIDLHNIQLELNKNQNEVMQLKLQTSKLESQLSEKDKAIESTSSEIMQLKEKINHSYAEVNQAKQEVSKYEMTLKSKDDEINFLRGHISQLTQTISQQSLRPSQEEVKNKGWWQFWKH